MDLRIPAYWDHDRDPVSYHRGINGITKQDLQSFCAWYSHEFLNLPEGNNDLPVDMFKQTLFNGISANHTFRAASDHEQFVYPLHHSYVHHTAISFGQAVDEQSAYMQQYISRLSISSTVLAAACSKAAKIMLFNSWEAWPARYWETVIAAICQRYSMLQPDDFIVASQNLVLDRFMPAISYCAFQEVCVQDDAVRDAAVLSITQASQRAHKFICLNRIPRYHRFYALAKLWPDRDLGLLSFVFNIDALGWNRQDDTRDYMTAYPARIKSLLADPCSKASHHVRTFMESCKDQSVLDDYAQYDLLANLPLLINDGVDSRRWATYDNEHDKFFNSYLNIVTETNGRSDNEEIFITEKTFKAMQHLQPFVILAGADYLAALRQMGYQTFGTWIDESYDHIPDDDLRYSSALASAKQFYDRDTADLNAIMLEMLPVLLHNYQTMYSNATQLQKLVYDRLQQLF